MLRSPTFVIEKKFIHYLAGGRRRVRATAVDAGRAIMTVRNLESPFWIGNLRLVLDAVLTSGKQHTSGHGKAALARNPAFEIVATDEGAGVFTVLEYR